MAWLFVAALIVWLAWPSSKSNEPDADPAVAEALAKAEVTPVAGDQWTYSWIADEMSKGTRYIASVSSSNTVEFDRPYSGAQHATLILRTDPRHGKDVIFNIEKGQILCRTYEDCDVLVRFDEEDAGHYAAVGSADNDSTVMFIRDYSRFVGKLLKAKRVRISVNIYQQGSPVFDFDLSGFDVEQYKPKDK